MTHDLLQILGEALHPDLRILPHNGKLTFMEAGTQATNKGFPIQASAKQVSFSLDVPRNGKIDAIFPSLNVGAKGFTSRCDGVVVAASKKDSSSFVVILIELKSTNHKGYLDQMKSTRAYVRWLEELATIHKGFHGSVHCYGLLVTARKTPKRFTSRPAMIQFEDRNGLRVAEWDHSVPLTLTQILSAALG